MELQLCRQLGIGFPKFRCVLCCLFVANAAKRQRPPLYGVGVDDNASAAADDPRLCVVAHSEVVPRGRVIFHETIMQDFKTLKNVRV